MPERKRYFQEVLPLPFFICGHLGSAPTGRVCPDNQLEVLLGRQLPLVWSAEDMQHIFVVKSSHSQGFQGITNRKTDEFLEKLCLFVYLFHSLSKGGW